jgi:aryl-alcohol dehydrogenase-like predicted oxidoreductase
MRTIRLGETGLSSSVLGFGCSALLGRSGRKESLQALGAAWDCGITFFDTARSYGYGESEALLGEFLKTRRDRAIVSTKFGILPSPQPLWKQVAKPVARAVLTVAPAARGAIRRKTAKEFTAGHFTVGVLEKSLHASLTKLKTDYVDLLFMHAAPASALENHELLRALEKLVQAGKVKIAGISADPDVIALALQKRPRPLHAVQFPCNIFDLSAAGAVGAAAGKGWAAVANHPFGGVQRVQESRAVLREIAHTPSTPPSLQAKLGEVDDAVLADVVLNIVTRTPGVQVVVPAMMKAPHLRTNVNAITNSRFSSDQIDWLRRTISLRHAEVSHLHAEKMRAHSAERSTGRRSG